MIEHIGFLMEINALIVISIFLLTFIKFIIPSLKILPFYLLIILLTLAAMLGFYGRWVAGEEDMIVGIIIYIIYLVFVGMEMCLVLRRGNAE